MDNSDKSQNALLENGFEPTVGGLDGENGKCLQENSASTVPNKTRRDRSTIVSSRSPNVDTGYAWVILAAVFIVIVLDYAIEGTSTFMYQQIVLKFNMSVTLAGWVPTMCTSIRLFSSPIVSQLYSTLSCRAVSMLGILLSMVGFMMTAFATHAWMLYLGYGVILGIGSNLIKMSAYVIIAQYFVRRRGLAMSISLTGNAVSVILFPNLVAQSYERYGYTQTVIYLACMHLHTLIPVALYRTQNPNNNDNGDGIVSKTEDVSPDEIDPIADKGTTRNRSNIRSFINQSGIYLLSNGTILSLMATVSTLHASIVLATVFISGLAIERANLTQIQIANVLTYAALADLTKLGIGFCFDRERIRKIRVTLFGLGCVASGVVGILTTFTNNMLSFTLSHCLLFFLYNGMYSQCVTILGDVLPESDLPKALGLCRCMMGIVLIFVPIVVGRIKDVWDSFRYGYILVSSVRMLISLLFLIIYHRNKGSRKYSV